MIDETAAAPKRRGPPKGVKRGPRRAASGTLSFVPVTELPSGGAMRGVWTGVLEKLKQSPGQLARVYTGPDVKELYSKQQACKAAAERMELTLAVCAVRPVTAEDGSQGFGLFVQL